MQFTQITYCGELSVSLVLKKGKKIHHEREHETALAKHLKQTQGQN